MRFEENMPVYTFEGEHLGDINRVVMDPRTKEVTHLVIREGFLFTEDKVLPIDLIGATGEDRAVLRETDRDPDDLPRFEETEFVPMDRVLEVEDQADQTIRQAPPRRPLLWYPPAGARWWGVGPAATAYPAPPPYVVMTERHIPAGTVPLQEGASVTAANGEHVGDIAIVLTDPTSNRATHFVIEEGLLFKERKLVPTSWINTVNEQAVQLAVGSQLLDSLPEYRDN